MKIRFLSMALWTAGCLGAAEAQEFKIAEEMFPAIFPTPFQEPTPADVAIPYRWINLLVDVHTPTPGPGLLEPASYHFALPAYGYPHWVYADPQRLYWLPWENGQVFYFNVGYTF